MISSKTVAVYGYVTISILLVLLALVWFHLVDPSFHVPILIFAAVLIVSRIGLRFFVRREDGVVQRRHDKESSDTDATGVG